MLEKGIVLKDGSEVLLRSARPQDIEMLWKMLSTLSEDSLRFLPSPIVLEEIETQLESINHEKLLPIVAVVDEGLRERIVDISTLSFQEGISRRHRAEFDIIVHDEYQGRGLGTMLTQYMLDIAKDRGLKKVHLNTNADNQRAIHVYRKLGFRVEGRLVMEYYHHLTKEYGDVYRTAILLRARATGTRSPDSRDSMSASRSSRNMTGWPREGSSVFSAARARVLILPLVILPMPPLAKAI